ncbi:MAG: hypothetical protein P8X85_14795 [Desulfobacterales bacterium]|jgi:hypothetical protein
MANQFAVEIHNYISEKIAHAIGQIKNADAATDPAGRRFYEGQLYELNKIREYMAQHIDLKTQKYY